MIFQINIYLFTFLDFLSGITDPTWVMLTVSSRR